MNVVYFIQSGPGGPVKIGTAGNAEKRMRMIQVGNPVKLMLIGTVPGGSELEAQLHRRFAAGHIHSEWFDIDTPGLRDLLAYVFRHGEMPAAPEDPDPPMWRGCSTCAWLIEPELSEHGKDRCWACLTEDTQTFRAA